MTTRVEEERLRRLQLITDAALAHLQLEELLHALLDRTRDALEVDTVAILLVERETQELVARAAIGIEEEVEQAVRIPLGKGFAGRVAADRTPVFLPDVDHADVLNPILREKGIKSLLGVPLLIEGEPIGVLHVGSLVPRTFGQDDVDLLQLAADRAAIAIEHARVFEAERRARERLEHVQSVTDAALGLLDLQELLNELVHRIRDILDTDTVAFLLLDEASGDLIPRAALGIEEEVEQEVHIPVGKGFAGRVAAEQRPIFVADVDTFGVVNPILREKKLKSMLGAPLVVRGETVGVLHVGSLSHRVFTDDDAELLQLVADRVAVAIQAARLHDELVRLDHLKANFVAIASHELRTPATSIYGAVATLRARKDTLTPEIKERLEETLWEQSNRFRRLIEQLLDLSRLDSRAVRIEARPIVLRKVVEDVVQGASEEVEPADVTIDVDPGLAVIADPVAVERVLTNLIVNAQRYGRPPIVVSARQSDLHLRLAVEDAGEGVPPELAERLFDRFERGLDAKGSGLGLAIAKAYARAHGGDLVYERGRRGARFEFVVPVSRDQ